MTEENFTLLLEATDKFSMPAIAAELAENLKKYLTYEVDPSVSQEKKEKIKFKLVCALLMMTQKISGKNSGDTREEFFKFMKEFNERKGYPKSSE